MTDTALISEPFIPARPPPRIGALRPLQAIRSRNNHLSNFSDDDYQLGVAGFRILFRRMVMVNTPEGAKHVLTDHSDNYARKSPQLRRALEYLVGDGLFISDGETWRHRRPLVADILHRNRLPEFAPGMSIEIDETIAQWSALPEGALVNVIDDMAALTARIISRTVFGVPLAEADARAIVAHFTAYQAEIDSSNVGYLFGLDNGLPVWRGPRLRRAIKGVHQVIDTVIEGMRGTEQYARMLELMEQRQSRDPKARLGQEVLRNETATMFMAGYESTATLLSWAWYLLEGAPAAEAAVHAELAEVLGGRAPVLADVASLPYCRAVIEETMRLYPPVPFLGRQAIAADTIGGTPVEPGAVVFVSPWLLHRTRGLWDDPHAFIPERFLGPTRPAPYSYIPFALGPRICPGMNFGLGEAVLSLAALAQRFRPRLEPSHVVEPRCRLTLRPAGGMPMRIHRR